MTTTHNNNYYHNYPLNIDSRGRTASASLNDHIRQLIEQVLFTAPGERVNRPTFGSGINQLIFAPNSNEIATATQFLVHGALQQWLSDLIHVEAVTVNNEDSTLHVVVHYLIKKDQQRQMTQFLKEV